MKRSYPQREQGPPASAAIEVLAPVRRGEPVLLQPIADGRRILPGDLPDVLKRPPLRQLPLQEFPFHDRTLGKRADGKRTGVPGTPVPKSGVLVLIDLK